MAALTFDDFLTGESRARTGTVAVKGVGHVTLHELTLDELDAVKTEVQAQETDEAVGQVIATWAMRMVKGTKPTKAEMREIGKRFSPSQLSAIYFAGLQFNLVDGDAKEAIEKN